MGAKVGDAGLARLVAERNLESARRRIKKRTRTAVLAVLSLIPPPFPFTPIVLAAGALEVRRSRFFATLAACRFASFGAEAFLARRYGPKTLDWLDSPVVEYLVLGFLAIGILLTAATIVRLARAPKKFAAPRGGLMQQTLLVTALNPYTQIERAGETTRIFEYGRAGTGLVVLRAHHAPEWQRADRRGRSRHAGDVDDPAHDRGVLRGGAEDGLEALHLLRTVRHRAPDVPCLVLLDLKMPRLGGNEFRRAQLGDPIVASVPMAVMSGAVDAQERAETLGAVATLTKPIDLDVLLDVVRKYCA